MCRESRRTCPLVLPATVGSFSTRRPARLALLERRWSVHAIKRHFASVLTAGALVAWLDTTPALTASSAERIRCRRPDEKDCMTKSSWIGWYRVADISVFIQIVIGGSPRHGHSQSAVARKVQPS